MVIKTQRCFYTEMPIYPGHGLRFVRRDGKLLAFLNAKSRSMYDQRIKAQRLKWTQAYRRKVKKLTNITSSKRRVKKTTKALRSIAGMSVDDIKARRLAENRSHRRDQSKVARLKRTAKTTTTKTKKVKRSNMYQLKKNAGGFVKTPKMRRANVGNRR